uniref:PDZ domain-containing protein n=1 Tax=Panagrolaimus superbus TaxID=310955 RepID=A0A914YPC7_9BILA
MTHSDVVDTLRMERSPIIQLTVDRARSPIEKEQIISVSLEKSHNTSLGLSLAKRMGREGIYIRSIAVGSIAAKDDRLKQGDKIWEVDGENVADESANAIVEKLKSVEGRLVEIVVKRTLE